MNPDEIISTISQGFGETVGKVGIIIIAGIIIGAFLEHSGGAQTLAQLVLNMVGKKRIYTAMSVIGYIVSIPVFADSGFVILSSLNRALTKKANVSLAGTAIALSLGLTAAHTMVPPTPGPITAAGILNADLGLVILIGLYASIGGLVATNLFASKIASKVWIDPGPIVPGADTERGDKNSPPPVKALLPILVPIVLIILRSVATYPSKPLGDGSLVEIINYIGNPVAALLIGIVLSLMLPEKLEKSMLSTDGWVGQALASAAVIILITGAGGAFGTILKTSDIGEILAGYANDYPLGLWLPFLVAAIVKSAQGSSTVALTTAAAIMAPLMAGLGMESEMEKAIVVIAIGAGSAVISHTNDSFFWVVTQMSDMTVSQGYRLQSLGTAILGFTAMILLSILNLFI